MSLQQYKPITKTIVTEVRQFIVDVVRKVQTFNQSSSANVSDGSVANFEVTVDKDTPFTIHNVNNCLSISTPSTVVLTLDTSAPAVATTSDVPVESVRMEVDDIKAADFIYVRLYNVTDEKAEVTCYNRTTGETETIVCEKQKDMHFGVLPTSATSNTGTNFDNLLSCSSTDLIVFTYGSATVSKTVLPAYTPTYLDVINVLINGYIMPVSNTSLLITVTNTRTQSSRTISPVQPVPILAGFEETDTTLLCAPADILQVHTKGIDEYGTPVDLYKNITILSASTPAITVSSTVNEGFPVTVTDPSCPESVVVRLTNTGTSVYKDHTLDAMAPRCGVYKANIDDIMSFCGPTYPVTCTYSGVSKTFSIITPDQPTVEETFVAPARIASAINVNGLFVLNGSFEGTATITCDTPTRCTIMKA